MLLLLIWASIDFYFFIINLFSKKIRPKYTETRIDGVPKDKLMNKKIIPATLNRRMSAILVIMKHRKVDKYETNPIKAGISNITLKVLKATLIILKERFKPSKNRYSQLAHCYVPTKVIVEELRDHLLVFEQLNSILLGVSYDQDTNYFHSSSFKKLVEGLELHYPDEFEKEKQASFDTIINGTKNEEVEESKENLKSFAYTSERKIHGVDFINAGSLVFDNEISRKSVRQHPSKPQSRWEKTLINFIMTNSNKYILDQYNLLKKFLAQNSIEKDDYELPKIIQKFIDSKIQRKFRREDKFIKAGKEDSNFARPRRSEYNYCSQRQSYTVIDINSLVLLIQEIERKSEFMKSHKFHNDLNEEIDFEEYSRSQLALINCRRNHKAI